MMRVFANLTVWNIVASAAVFLGCGRTQPQVAPTSTNASAGETTEAMGTTGSAGDEAIIVSDCTSKAKCPKVEIEVQLIDMATGDTVNSLKGVTLTQVAWGLKALPTDSKAAGRKYLLKINDESTDVEVSRKANTAIAMGSFATATTGSLTATYRDVDYCKLNSKKPDDCTDIDQEMSLDQTQEVAFTITQSSQQQAQAAAEAKQKQAQSNVNNAQCMAGMFSVFTGKIGGIAGCAGTIMSQ